MANSELSRPKANQPGEQPRTADEQARRILDAVPQKIVSAPADGALDYCNFQWRAYTGLTRGRLARVGVDGHRLRTGRTAPEVPRWFGSSTDIDDYKRAEEALRESERRFNQAHLFARLGYWEHDLVADRFIATAETDDLFGLPVAHATR